MMVIRLKLKTGCIIIDPHSTRSLLLFGFWGKAAKSSIFYQEKQNFSSSKTVKTGCFFKI